MWVKFMEVPDGYAAAIWKELFSTEALSVRVVPPLEVGEMRDAREIDRKSTRLNSSHVSESRMPSSA